MNFFIGNQTTKLLLLDNLQPHIKVNQRELFNNKYMVNTSRKYSSLSNKKFWFFEKKFSKNKLKFNFKKK